MINKNEKGNCIYIELGFGTVAVPSGKINKKTPFIGFVEDITKSITGEMYDMSKRESEKIFVAITFTDAKVIDGLIHELELLKKSL